MNSPILVTGAAGFIGFHVARRLLQDGHRVVGVDSFSSYYDPGLKEARFSHLLAHEGFAPERLASSVVMTPTCGLAGATPANTAAAPTMASIAKVATE